MSDRDVILAALIRERNDPAWYLDRWREEHTTDRPTVGPIFH